MSEHNRKEAECAMDKCRRVRREKNEEIDALKIKHRQSLQQHKKSHATKVKAKNKLLDDMWKEVEHARENVSLILDELGQEKKKSRKSKKKAAAAELRAHKAARGWKSLMEKHAELNDEVKDMENKVEELEEKVAEYDMIIDLMQNDFEEMSEQYKTEKYDLIDYMNHYYEETRPRKIAKRWVPNEKSGKSSHAMSMSYYHFLILTSPFASIIQSRCTC